MGIPTLAVKEQIVDGNSIVRVVVFNANGGYIGTLEFRNHCEMREAAQMILEQTISD